MRARRLRNPQATTTTTSSSSTTSTTVPGFTCEINKDYLAPNPDFPECGGSCPAGFECLPIADTLFGTCECNPSLAAPCAASGGIGVCGGACPAGEVCSVDQFFFECMCAPLDGACEDTHPLCGGSCPPGQHCRLLGVVPPTGGCGCVPD